MSILVGPECPSTPATGQLQPRSRPLHLENLSNSNGMTALFRDYSGTGHGAGANLMTRIAHVRKLDDGHEASLRRGFGHVVCVQSSLRALSRRSDHLVSQSGNGTERNPLHEARHVRVGDPPHHNQGAARHVNQSPGVWTAPRSPICKLGPRGLQLCNLTPG